jgi:hypothetical protein
MDRLHVRNMACALLFFAPGNNQPWRVAEWLVKKANSELKAVAVREAAAVLPAAAAVVVSPEVVVARVVVAEAASQAAVVVDKEAVSQAAAVVDKEEVSLVAEVAAADKAVVAVRAVVVVDARAAAAADKVAGDKAEEGEAGPAVEVAVDPLVAEWEAEARVVVAAVVVPPVVVAAAETAKAFDSGGASRICGAPLFVDALRRRDGVVAALDRAARRHVSPAASVAFARQRKRHPSAGCATRVCNSSRAKRGPQYRALREVDFVDELSQSRAHRRR